MARLQNLVSEEAYKKMYAVAERTVPKVIDFSTVRKHSIVEVEDYEEQPVIKENIPYPTVFKYNVGAWVCKCSPFSVCTRRYQTRDNIPDCLNCAIRKGGVL